MPLPPTNARAKAIAELRATERAYDMARGSFQAETTTATWNHLSAMSVRLRDAQRSVGKR